MHADEGGGLGIFLFCFEANAASYRSAETTNPLSSFGARMSIIVRSAEVGFNMWSGDCGPACMHASVRECVRESVRTRVHA